MSGINQMKSVHVFFRQDFRQRRLFVQMPGQRTKQKNAVNRMTALYLVSVHSAAVMPSHTQVLRC